MFAAAVDAVPVPGELLGPYGLLIGALLVVGILWREGKLREAEAKQRDADYHALLHSTLQDRTSERDVAIEGWRAQTDATNRVAETLEEDRRDRLARSRMSDRRDA